VAAVYGLTILGSPVQAPTLCWELPAALPVVGRTDASPGFPSVTRAAAGVRIAATTSPGQRPFAAAGLRIWAIEVGDVLGPTVIGVVLAFVS